MGYQKVKGGGGLSSDEMRNVAISLPFSVLVLLQEMELSYGSVGGWL